MPSAQTLFSKVFKNLFLPGTFNFFPSLPKTQRAHLPYSAPQEIAMVPSSLGLPRPAAAPASDPTRTVQPVSNTAPSAETRLPPSATLQISAPRSAPRAITPPPSVAVSIKSSHFLLALLYRTAIDRINQQLASELGGNAIADTGTPVHTPESTAGRILSVSTAFYGASLARHTDQEPETTARHFVERIRTGFESGFGEARDILTDLGALGPDHANAQGIEKTYALVMQGLDDFLAAQLSSRANPTPPPSAGAATP